MRFDILNRLRVDYECETDGQTKGQTNRNADSNGAVWRPALTWLSS